MIILFADEKYYSISLYVRIKIGKVVINPLNRNRLMSLTFKNKKRVGTKRNI